MSKHHAILAKGEQQPQVFMDYLISPSTHEALIKRMDKLMADVGVTHEGVVGFIKVCLLMACVVILFRILKIMWFHVSRFLYGPSHAAASSGVTAEAARGGDGATSGNKNKKKSQ